MLYVKDLERMKQFYGQLLRFQPSNDDSTGVWAVFQNGGVQFALHAVPSHIAASIEITSPPEPRENDPVKLIFEVEDVEAERERLDSIGIRTLRRPWQQTGKAFDAIDPEGNILQICSWG